MPDMRNSDYEYGRDGDALAESLRAVQRDNSETQVPPHVEAFVMRAWDAWASADACEPRRATRRPLWFAALAASALLVAAIWMQRGGGGESGYEGGAESAYEQSLAGDGFVPYPIEAMATVDVVLDEDPASLQLVQLSIQPSVLTAFGFPVADPADDRPVEVEVLVGLDGVPRAIRHASFVQE